MSTAARTPGKNGKVRTCRRSPRVVVRGNEARAASCEAGEQAEGRDEDARATYPVLGRSPRRAETEFHLAGQSTVAKALRAAESDCGGMAERDSEAWTYSVTADVGASTASTRRMAMSAVGPGGNEERWEERGARREARGTEKKRVRMRMYPIQ